MIPLGVEDDRIGHRSAGKINCHLRAAVYGHRSAGAQNSLTADFNRAAGDDPIAGEAGAVVAVKRQPTWAGLADSADTTD